MGRCVQAHTARVLIGTCAPPCVQLKQMAELEQEKEVLLRGLQMTARGRAWCQQQLQRVQERQRRLGQSRASAVSDTAWAHPPATTHLCLAPWKL